MPRKQIPEYHCDNCSYRSFRMNRLITHLRLNGKFICDQCGAQLNSSITIKRHILNHSQKKKLTCDKCKKVLSSRQKLAVHITHDHDSKEYHSCDECYLKLKTKLALMRHWQKEHLNVSKREPQERKACDLCGNEFSNLVVHFQSKHSETINYRSPIVCIICDSCDKTYSGAHGFLLHWKKAHCGIRRERPKNFVCDICLHRSHTAWKITGHILANHDPSKAKLKCTECSASFARKHELKKHSRKIHTSS